MKDLSGKVAFVTGAASGIGLAMARAFAGAGMKVALADIEEEALGAAVEEFARSNAEVIGIPLDIRDRAAMNDAANAVERAFGKVHLVCNNAGVGGGGPLDTVTYKDWDWVLGVNLGGVVNGVQTFVPRLKSHGEGGHIVNTASVAGLVAAGGMGVYNTSKFAVVGLSEALRQDLGPYGIGVSVLCPGFVRTRIWESARNRPKELQNEIPRTTMQGPNRVLDEGIDPGIVGERVLEGVLANDLYIFTHPEFHHSVLRRTAALLDAFGADGPGFDRDAFDDIVEAARAAQERRARTEDGKE